MQVIISDNYNNDDDYDDYDKGINLGKILSQACVV